MANRYNIIRGIKEDVPKTESVLDTKSSNIITFGLETDLPYLGNKPVSKFHFFRLSGANHDIQILQGDGRKLFCGLKVHFASINGMNRYIVCKSSQGALCCNNLQKPVWRIGSVIYNHNEGIVQPWVFSQRTYSKLRESPNHLPISDVCFSLRCTNIQFQTFEFNSSRHISPVYCKEFIHAYRRCIEQCTEGLGLDLPIEELNTAIKITPDNSTTRMALHSSGNVGLGTPNSNVIRSLDEFLSDESI